MPFKRISNQCRLRILLVILNSLLAIILTGSMATIASVPQKPDVLSSTPVQSKTTLEVLRTLNREHFSPIKVNDDLSSRFLDKYLKRLDPNKLYFLQSDIDEFNKKRYLLDDELKSGQNQTGFTIYQRLTERLRDRLKSTVTTLENDTSPINFNLDEKIIVDPETRSWAKDLAALDDYWRRHIKSTFLTQKLAGEDPEKTRTDLIKRYSTQLDRISKTTTEDVYELFINSFTELYDPHTNYLSPRASESFNIRMSLSLEGIGAVLQNDDGYTKVIRIVTAGPADKQGQLKASDRISGVGQGEAGDIINVVDWRLDEVVELIRGPKGSIVRLEVLEGEIGGGTKIVRIKRDKVKLEDQAAQKAVMTIDGEDGAKSKIGIISLPTFYMDFDAYNRGDPNFRSTSRDVANLIIELTREGIDGLVIDLRANGGGSLEEATRLTDLFIDKGPVVQISTGGQKNYSLASRQGPFYDGPLLVLINRLSASASEIFAGAIQDYNRGLIVGSQSFGKGTVQTLTNLRSQGKLKWTDGKFYRVSGKSTQHKGVVPDIKFPELIDPAEVGESSYETALSWSTIKPLTHRAGASLNNVIQKLSEKHASRMASNPDFIFLNKRKQLLDELNGRKTLSLNEKQRLKEKKQQEHESLAMENKRRIAKGQQPYKTFSELEKANDAEREQRAATAGTTIIDTKNDAALEEASRILSDYISLSFKPNKVAATPK